MRKNTRKHLTKSTFFDRTLSLVYGLQQQQQHSNWLPVGAVIVVSGYQVTTEDNHFSSESDASRRKNLRGCESRGMSQRPPFCSYLAASGHAETWDHSDVNKFKQFGWRCTTNETGYAHNTLIGNWNEEWYDTKMMAKRKPMPSQVRWDCVD